LIDCISHRAIDPADFGNQFPSVGGFSIDFTSVQQDFPLASTPDKDSEGRCRNLLFFGDQRSIPKPIDSSNKAAHHSITILKKDAGRIPWEPVGFKGEAKQSLTHLI